jgi:hypothetical protein
VVMNSPKSSSRGFLHISSKQLPKSKTSLRYGWGQETVFPRSEDTPVWLSVSEASLRSSDCQKGGTGPDVGKRKSVKASKVNKVRRTQT